MTQNFRISKFKILTIFLFVGIWLFGWTYYIAYKGNFYNTLFWASMVTIGSSIFLIIIDKDISEKYKIGYIFVFGTMIYMLNVLPSTMHFHFNDELVTYETTKLIDENGGNILDIQTHFDMPKYYPGLGLTVVLFKQITNLDIFTVSRILIGLAHSLLLIFLYMFLKEVSLNERIAAIGTFIYATNPLYVYFHSQYSYESVGIFLGICLLYLISKKSFGEKPIYYSITIIIILATLTITHHLSSLMIFLFIILLMIAVRYENYRIKSYPSFHTKITFLTGAFIFIWMTYVATAVIGYLYNHFIDNIKKIFELSLFGGSKMDISSASLNAAQLPTYEWIIDSRIYAPLLILLSIIGIVFVYKYENRNAFLYAMIIYGPILYILSLGLILTSGQELALRTWGFSYIGLSLMSAITIDKLIGCSKPIIKNFTQISSFSAIILILIGGISIGDKPIHRFPDLLSPKLLGSGSMTTDVFRSAEWFEHNFGRYNNMSGDRTTSSIFTYYGGQNADIQGSWKIFFPDKMDKNVSNFIKRYKIDYIIVDRRINKSLAEDGFYFGKEKQSEYYIMRYGSMIPLPKERIEKFDYSKNIYDIYDNSNIVIYKIIKENNDVAKTIR